VALPSIRDEVELGILVGPSDEWFQPSALAILTSTPWSVSPTSSRIGLRLQGPHLPRRNDNELPPEGMVTGSVQVPPNGQPVILLADRPVTGGYPVIGVVREGDLHFAAQAAPGTTVRLRRQRHPG
jgi:allophanate hydrolase subunit 2